MGNSSSSDTFDYTQYNNPLKRTRKRGGSTVENIDDMDHYDAISDAIVYIKKMYHRIYKRVPSIWQENGEITVALVSLWCRPYKKSHYMDADTGQYYTLCRLFYKACQKHPEAAPELAWAAYRLMPSPRKLGPQMLWLNGYFSRALEVDEDVEFEFMELEEYDVANNNFIESICKSYGDQYVTFTDIMGEPEDDEEDDDE